MKKVALIVSLLLVASVLLIAAAPAYYTHPIRLTLINNTGENLHMSLTNSKIKDPVQTSPQLYHKVYYYLTVLGSNTSATDFWIERSTTKYTRTTWACGYTNTGKLLATTNVRLNFPNCTKAANKGEPTQEKVVIKTSPLMNNSTTKSPVDWRWIY